ncbi:MAG: T9SS type A sorting domain-containing protein, partial [Bacteroidota bacterium]
PMFTGISYTSGVTNTVIGHGFITIIYAFNGSLTNASVTPFAICQGQTATITANGSTSYTWSTNSNSNAITVNPTSNTTYTVTGTNSIGCVSNAVITVTVTSGTPVISVNTSTNQICLGKTVTLTASGALTYTWTGGVTNGVSYAPTSTSNYTVLGQNGCGTTSAVTTVSVAPLAVGVVASPTAVCAGLATTLTAASAGTSYTWQPFGLPGASVVVSPNLTTIYTVSTSDGTCSGVATIAVVANPIPTLTCLISNTNICQGAAITLTASGANGYTWSPGNLNGSVISVTPNVPTQFSVVGNNSIGCLGGAAQIVIVSPSPTLVVSANNPVVCAGGSATLNVSGADTYAWSNSSTSNSIAVNPSTSSNYTVAGTFTSGPGCSSSTVISVGVFTPTLSVTGGTSTCIGNAVNLSASSAGTWLWSNGATSQGISVTPTVNLIITCTALTTSGSINCPASASIQVTVYQNPTLTATSSRSAMCKGENNTLTVGGASTYTWSTGATTTSIAITPSLVTTLTYSINGTSSNGCLGTASLQVKVNACTGLDQINAAKVPVLIYPNPSNGEINLSAQSDMKLVIVNELGQIVKSLILDQTNDRTMMIKDLAKGLYFVVSQNTTEIVRERIVILK